MAKAFDIGGKAIKIYKKEESSDNEDSNEVFILDELEMLLEEYFIYIILASKKLVWIAYQEVEAIFE